jgi:hypothetical protein
MTTEEIDEAAELPQVCKFFHGQNKTMDRFIKVMSREEDNIMSGLILDQFFKTLLVKLDSVLLCKDR